MNNWSAKAQKYLLNCFLLVLPIMAWNIFLADDLPQPFQPEIFWNEIPSVLAVGDQVSRTLIFILALLMPLSVKSEKQRKGIGIYLAGILTYFASWLALIYYPDSTWSISRLGFLAPAYTPLLWLSGIALTGHKFYFNFPYRTWLFMALSIIFLVFHNIHTFIIYNRIYGG